MTTKHNTGAQQQAAEWVTRLYSGEMTVQEERQLRHWRQQAPHEQAFQNALVAWELSGQLYGNADAKPSVESRPSCPNAVNASAPRKPWHAFAAASVAVALLSSALWFLPNDNTNQASREQTASNATPGEPLERHQTEATLPSEDVFRITEHLAQLNAEQTRTFTTDTGEVSHIQLDDGSNVSLNTASAVRVTMGAEQRHVELLYGEAYFDVAKDLQRPFVVSTDKKEITVLGTKFNVRQRSDERALQVAVVEGRVAVKRREINVADQPAQRQMAALSEKTTNDNLGDYEQLLRAGDIAAFSSDSNVIKKDQRDADKSNSWRWGVVRFDDERLQKVIHELNRYRKYKIQFADADLHDLRISGVFHLKNGDAILDALSATLPINVRRSPSHVTLEPRG